MKKHHVKLSVLENYTMGDAIFALGRRATALIWYEETTRFYDMRHASFHA